MKIVEKKILPGYFKDVKDGRKHFELREDSDDIHSGDVLKLNEYDPNKGYTGNYVTVGVTYVLRNVPEFGLKPGYCIIGW